MNFGVWGSLRDVIDRVRFENERMLSIRNHPVSKFLPIDIRHPKYEAISAVFLGSAYRSGLEHNEEYRIKTFGMASLFNLILLAADVHDRIEDNTCLPDESDHLSLHYPVLIGDYIFGILLKRLCDLGCIEILPELSSVICDINEGAMRRDELSVSGGSPLEYISAVKMEYGSAYRQAALTGMWMAGDDSDQAFIYGEMSCLIGMTIGMEQLGMDPALAIACRSELLDRYHKLEYGNLKRVSQHLLRYAGIERKTLRAASGQ